MLKALYLTKYFLSFKGHSLKKHFSIYYYYYYFNIINCIINSLNMNLRFLKLKHVGSVHARYQPYTFKPSSWPKPNNIDDNLDPNRLDRNIKPVE